MILALGWPASGNYLTQMATGRKEKERIIKVSNRREGGREREGERGGKREVHVHCISYCVCHFWYPFIKVTNVLLKVNLYCPHLILLITGKGPSSSSSVRTP